jgi:Protein of unknown function (DUF2637)
VSAAPGGLDDSAELAACGRPRPMSAGERRSALAVGVLAAALGVLGFVNSYRAVSRAAASSFGSLAPTVPPGIDLAIAVFSGIDLVLARLDMRPRWVRLVPWSLTAATVFLNVTGQVTWFGRIAHAVFPSLWVAAVSLAAHVIRVRVQLAEGTSMDRVRPSRWLLAPVSTALIKRRMVLWEIRSYPLALARERERLLALTGLQDTYGVIAWRWRAPRRLRMLYRLGELEPAGQLPDQSGAEQQPGEDGAVRTIEPESARAAAALAARHPAAGPRPGNRRPRAPGTQGTPAVTTAAVAEHFRAELDAGQLPSGKAIRRTWGVGSDVAAELVKNLSALYPDAKPAGPGRAWPAAAVSQNGNHP